MINDAFNLKEYMLAQVDKEIDYMDKVLRYSSDEAREYERLLNKFKETNGSDASTKIKGLALEDLVKYIIDKSVIFEGYQNLRTSSNEIDILVRLNDRGRHLKTYGLQIPNEKFIAECKNYKTSIGSTWVGKFASLMNYTHNTLGILFSYHGLSGSGWNEGTGLTKKLLLSDKKTHIIDFNMHDFNLLLEGKSFNSIINDKIFALSQDISVEHLITIHPNQEVVDVDVE